MSIIAPTQTRTIDPWSEDRFTSALNRFTRIFTGGTDCLLFEESSFLFDNDDATSSTFVGFTSGIAIKDDCVIHVIEDGAGVDFVEDDYYLDEIPGPLTSGWYYIVLYYNYDRSYPPPKAYYRILRDISIFETYKSNYLFLAAVNLLVTDTILYTENDINICTEDDENIIIESNSLYYYTIEDIQYYDPVNPTIGKRIWLNISWISTNANLISSEDNTILEEE